MANIAFVEPRSSFNAYGYWRLPLMGSLSLGTILKEAGHEVLVIRDSVRSIHNEKTGWLHSALTRADVVAMSMITCTANRAYQIADAIRIDMRVSQGHRRFFFYDDNFAANREGTKILLDGMARRGLKIGWAAEARTDIAKDKELLELISRVNCLRMFIGLESVNPRTLVSYNKKQTVEDMKTCIPWSFRRNTCGRGRNSTHFGRDHFSPPSTGM